MLLGGSELLTKPTVRRRPLLPLAVPVNLPALSSLTSDRNHRVHKVFWAAWALFWRFIFEICWLPIFKRAQLEVQAYYRVQLIRAMVWNTAALWWWHCYSITVNDQNIKELIEVQSSIKVNWFFWQRMQMRSFDIVWIPTNYPGLVYAHFYGYQFMNSCVSHGERKRGVAIINIPFY